jgi:hypothetical protein
MFCPRFRRKLNSILEIVKQTFFTVEDDPKSIRPSPVYSSNSKDDSRGSFVRSIRIEEPPMFFSQSIDKSRRAGKLGIVHVQVTSIIRRSNDSKEQEGQR